MGRERISTGREGLRESYSAHQTLLERARYEKRCETRSLARYLDGNRTHGRQDVRCLSLGQREGDLSVTTTDLENDIKALEELHTECMTHANDFEVATKDRAEELKALATAKKIIVEATAGAQSISYGLDQVSFVQLGTSVRLSARSDLVKLEVVEHVKALARKQHSSMLVQLVSRMNSAVKLGSSESDVFAKIKGLITDMIGKLEKEAAEDATEAAYCAKETSETTEKKESNEAEIEKLTTKINQAKSRSAKLKSEVATLQEE